MYTQEAFSTKPTYWLNSPRYGNLPNSTYSWVDELRAKSALDPEMTLLNELHPQLFRTNVLTIPLDEITLAKRKLYEYLFWDYPIVDTLKIGNSHHAERSGNDIFCVDSDMQTLIYQDLLKTPPLNLYVDFVRDGAGVFSIGVGSGFTEIGILKHEGVFPSLFVASDISHAQDNIINSALVTVLVAENSK